MKALVISLVRAEATRFAIWVGGALLAVVLLKMFAGLTHEFFMTIPAIVAYTVAMWSAVNGVGGNLGWLLVAPISRRRLWLVNYGLNALRLAYVALAYFATDLLASQFDFAIHPTTGHPTTVPGHSNVPLTLLMLITLHMVLSVVFVVHRAPDPHRLRRSRLTFAVVVSTLAFVALTPDTSFFNRLNFAVLILMVSWAAYKNSVRGAAIPRQGRRAILALNVGLAFVALAYGLTHLDRVLTS